MTITQTLRQTPLVPPVPRFERGQRWRLPALGVLFVLALGGILVLAQMTPPDPEHSQTGFLSFWMLTYLPYLAACLLVLVTPPATGRRRWLELALILGGALLLRLPLIGLAPNLSRDSWRYVWDARVFLHGYSPYVYAPGDSRLIGLRDFILANSRFRNVPSIYPPGAQYVYILSYLLVPSSLFFLKGVFLVFDMASCVLLAVLLARKGQDPARALLYAWCPLPIVEFALQGHVDVITITCTLLTALAAQQASSRGRILTGFLVGLGTLTKVYPIVMLAPMVRLRGWRREWLLVATCLGTIVVGYIPFSIQGNGQIFGFFATYASEQGQNAGFVQLLVAQFAHSRHLSLASTVTLEHQVAFLLLGGLSLLVFGLYQVGLIGLEAGTLLLFGCVLSVSSHVFPWYVTTLLPWVVLLLPARAGLLGNPARVARLLALVAPWLLMYTSLLCYTADWHVYYLVVYDTLIVELCIAVYIALCDMLPTLWQKGVRLCTATLQRQRWKKTSHHLDDQQTDW